MNGLTCVKIEKKIPIPTLAPPKQKPHPEKYPFSKMNVGDSFFLSAEPTKAAKVGKSAYMAAYFAIKNGRLPKGYKIAYRQVPGGARVWRVE